MLQSFLNMRDNSPPGRTFTAAELFTALALFNQLAVCLSVFPVTVPIFIKGFVSRSRLLSFLCRPEAQGTAVSLDPSTEFQEDEKLEEEEEEEGKEKGQFVLRLCDASFSWHHTSPPVLRGISLALPTAGLTIVIGHSIIPTRSSSLSMPPQTPSRGPDSEAACREIPPPH